MNRASEPRSPSLNRASTGGHASDDTPTTETTMRLTVIGTGYVGAVHAACMAEIGHEVLGVDIDAERIGALGAGRPPFYEPGLSGMLKRMVDAGRLRFTTSLAEAARFAGTHFVCVGTPSSPVRVPPI